MSSKSLLKGFVLSSTPVQLSEEDSGYFGSSHRKNFHELKTNVLNAYSPIKELCFKNLSEKFPLEHDFDGISPQPKFDSTVLDYENFTKHVYESSSIGINELSNSGSPSDSVSGENKILKPSEQIFLNTVSFCDDTENKYCAFSSFSEENKDIKYKLFEYMPNDLMHENFKSLNNELPLSNTHVKHELQSLTAFHQTKIDFIHHLKEMNCLSLISCIFSYLSAEELCISSCINKEWNLIIQSDYNADFKRKNFLKERDLFFNGPSKENRLGMRSGPARELKKAFHDLTNINSPRYPLVTKDSNTRFDSFIKESRNGHLKLLKCPKCCYASKSLNGNNYKCTHCSHTFCSNCLGPVFKNHSCSKPQLPNIIVGSKKSKKNLRRL